MRLDVRRTDEVPTTTAEAFRADLETQVHREAGEELAGWEDRLAAFARERAVHYGVDIRITPETDGFAYDLMHIHERTEEAP